jgi:hypothetical protein
MQGKIAVVCRVAGYSQARRQSAGISREVIQVPEGEPCPYCAYLAANPEELRQHLLHMHPEAEPEPDWWDPDSVPPPLLQ